VLKVHNLYFEAFRVKLNTANSNLQKENEALETAKKKVREFINDDTFKGELAYAVKKQMEGYILVAEAMRLANDCDIEDCNQIYQELYDAQCSLGSFADLIGEEIIEYMITTKNLAKENKNRAQEYDRMQTESHNPVKDVWYQSKEIYYKNCAEHNEELYEEWKKKSHKYDEVQRNTANYFEKGKQLRQKAEIGLRELGKNYNGKSFDVYDDDGWKTELNKAIAQGSYIGLGSYGLNMESEEDGEVPFGGNQGWFKKKSMDKFLDSVDVSKLTDEEQKLFYEVLESFYDEDLNEALSKGCPVIALINTFYMMEGKTHVSRLEFMCRVYKFLNDHPEYKEKCKKKNWKDEFSAGLPAEEDDDKPSTEKYLDEYVKKNGYASGVEMKYIDEDRDSYDYIKEQVKKKRPVIISVTGVKDNYPKGVNLYEDNKGSLKQSANTHNHVMTITGVTRQVNPETGLTEDYCEVSSWGKKYYIPYSDISKYRNNIKIGEYQ